MNYDSANRATGHNLKITAHTHTPTQYTSHINFNENKRECVFSFQVLCRIGNNPKMEIDIEDQEVFASLSVQCQTVGESNVRSFFGTLIKNNECVDKTHNYCEPCLKERKLKR